MTNRIIWETIIPNCLIFWVRILTMFEKPTYRNNTRSEPVNKTHTQKKKLTTLPDFPLSNRIFYYIDLFKIPGKMAKHVFLGFSSNKTHKTNAKTWLIQLYPFQESNSIDMYWPKTNFRVAPRAPCSCDLSVFRWARRYMFCRPARPTGVSTDQHFQHVHYMEQQNTLITLINSAHSVHDTIIIYDTDTVNMYTYTTKNDWKKKTHIKKIYIYIHFLPVRIS